MFPHPSRNPNQPDTARSVPLRDPSSNTRSSAHLEAATGLCETGRMLYARGWAMATSGNYSVILQRNPLRLLVTASGRHKGELVESDFVQLGASGEVVAGTGQPSAETELHLALAGVPGIGAILHTHSVWNTLLSEAYFAQGEIELFGFELLKALEGISTHAARVPIAIFDNTQDITALASELRPRLAACDLATRHAFLIRGHGLYTWGATLADARRHVEALEFLFEVVGRRLSLPSALPPR